MINLELTRYSMGPDSTLGLLHNGHEFLCFTIEDESRTEKVPGETCIPVGTYEVTLRKEGGFHQRYSENFPDIHKGMLWVRNVPGFEYILIHVGNTDDDTEGCVLVGDSAVQNVTEQGMIGSSRAAYRRIYPPIADALEGGERVVLNVREAW